MAVITMPAAVMVWVKSEPGVAVPPNERAGTTPAGRGILKPRVPFAPPSEIEEDVLANSITKGDSVIIIVSVSSVPSTALPLTPVKVIMIVSLGSYKPSAAAVMTIPF